MPQSLGNIKQGAYGVTDLFTEQRKYDKDKSKFFVWRERGYASMVHVLITALPKVSVSDPEPKHFEDGYRPLAIVLTGTTISYPSGTTAPLSPMTVQIAGFTTGGTTPATDVNNFQVGQVWENGSIYQNSTDPTTYAGDASIITFNATRGADPSSTGDANNNYYRREVMLVLSVNTATGTVVFQRHIGYDTFMGANVALATTNTLYLHSIASTDGSGSPVSFSQNPVVVNNYVQIFKEPYEITDTTIKTDIFGENEWQRKARNARRNFARQLERAHIGGHMYKFTDANSNNELKWMMGGIEEWVPANTTNQISLNKVPTISLLNTQLKPVFDWGSNEKWGFCGHSAITKIGNSAVDVLRFNDKLSSLIGLEVKDFVQTAGGVIHLVPDYEMSQTNKDNEIFIADIAYLQYMYLEGEDIRIDKGKTGVGLQLQDEKKTKHQIYGTIGMKRTFADAHFHVYNLL